MKKSIFLFFAAILCAMSVGAAVVTPTGKYFYFKTNSEWKVDGARFAVCFQWKNGGGQDDSWYSCVNVEGDVYYVVAPAEYWDMYFCRMNGSTNVNSWANKWNQSTKLQYDGTNNYFQKNAGWNEDVTYNSNYAPPMSSVTLADNGTTVNSGTGTQADPYIIEIGTKIKVQASGTKAVDDPDAVINYAFKYGATSQDSETTTWEIDANSPSTTYAIELESYTKVNTTASTKKAATKLYYQTVADATLPTYQVTVTANDPAMGTVTGAGEYSEGATAELTATPNAGYRFVNWTDGGTEKSTNATYSFTVTENVALVANFEELPEETVYFINAGKWSEVHLHLWNGNAVGTEWPGTQLTATGEKISEYDVYSYTAKQGDHLNLLFHENTGDVNKTTDLTWAEGVDKYYIHNYNGNTGWYTKAEAEAILVVPVEYDYVYLINTNDWAKAHIYTWTPEVAGWPGAAMTLEAEQIAGKDVYSYKVVKGTTFDGLNFNCGGDECKTGDLTWQAGKYYAPSKDKWYDTKEAAAEALAPDPLATEVYLAGDMTNKDNWDVNKKEFRKATADATNASVTVTLEAQTYKFKLVIDGAWKGNTGTMQRGGDAVHEGGWSFDKDGYDDNCQIVADIAGDYTFTWNLTSKKLTVTYPELPTPTYDVTVADATVSTMGQNIVLSGNWEEKLLTVSLWQGGATQGFGTYATEDYAPIFLGTAELTPTSEGVYADKGDNTFTFTATANDAEGGIYNISVTGAIPADEPEVPTAIDNIDTAVAPAKVINNGQLIIIRNGVQYNAQGAVVK